MSAAGRWFITPHAVRAYRERIDRRADYKGALTALINISEIAHRVKPKGEAVLYRTSRAHGKINCLVAEGGPGLPQLLTVYGGKGR